MKAYFFKNNIFFIIKIISIILLSLSYYLVITLMNSKYKEEYLTFDSVNDSIYGVYKDLCDIFISLKRQLEFFERNLLNCTTTRERFQMKIPKVNEISIKKIGNYIMKITDDSNFKKETKDKFKLLYNENICKAVSDTPRGFGYCEHFWSGNLLKGMDQVIIQIESIIGTVLDELNYLNNMNDGSILFDLMNRSSFIIYEQFTEYYLLRAYNKTIYIFNDLGNELVNVINNKFGKIVLIYILISIFLFIILVYIVYSFKLFLNSFVNFICILPVKFMIEDERFYKEIIVYGNKY